MRPDGKRIREKNPIVSAIPYIMPKRHDAQNMVTEYAEMEPMRTYIHNKRREGVSITYMGLILAAYYKAYQENPKINRFVMNKHLYARNHFCVSFVLLRKNEGDTADETTLKVFFEEGDDVISISRKLAEVIEKNSGEQSSNATDRVARFMFSAPLLPTLVVGLARLLDHFGLLPRKVIDLSPFHTSLFITNLASINTSYIYHHCYDFGTTSVFVCMGKPVTGGSGEEKTKRMPLGVVMDERICTGYEYARFCESFRRYLRHPELLENPKTEE